MLIKTKYSQFYLPLLLGLSALLLVARGMGALPFVMADEYHYSFLSRLVPMRHTDDPVFLYLSVFHASFSDCLCNNLIMYLLRNH